MFDQHVGRPGPKTETGARPLRPLLAGAAAVAAAGLLAAPAQAAFPGKNGRVVYEKTPTNFNERSLQSYPYWDSTELWTSNASGGDLERLVSFEDLEYPAAAHDPAISADGKQVAYVESGEPEGRYDRIRVIGLDGTGDHLLRDDLDSGGAPAWSPDGKQIVYVDEGGEVTHLAITAADGSGQPAPVDLGDLGGNPNNPQWSPDGKWIAFDDHYRVYVVPADGSAEPVVVGNREDSSESIQDTRPNWAPDGSALLFERRSFLSLARAAAAEPSGPGLVEVPFEKGAPRNADETTVVEPNQNPEAGIYSPDGLKVLYSGFNFQPQGDLRSLRGLFFTPSLIVAGADGSNPDYFIEPSNYALIASDWAPIPPVKPQPKPETKPPVTVTVTPTPTTGAVQGESERRCGSRRRFVIRLRPKGVKIAMARVIVRGKRVKVRHRGSRYIATVDLRTLPKKRFKVDITVWSTKGKRYHEVRRYWTCTPAR